MTEHKFYVKIADIHMEICSKSTYPIQACREYLTEGTTDAQLVIASDEKDIEQEWHHSGEIFSKGYCESVCLCRAIAERILPFQGFLLHAAVVQMKGEGFAFAAPSGTGKSTHVGIWLQEFGQKARIINGDKPIIRDQNGTCYAYGTPWCGKENQGVNDRTVLSGICFLEREIENEIRLAEPKEVADRLLQQVLLPEKAEEMVLFLELLDQFLKKVPCYIMRCNTQPEAAWMAYETMKKENKNT